VGGDGQLFEELVSEQAQACSAVEDDDLVAHPDLDAAGIAADARGLRSR
jgi:hypothetical protein